MRGEQEYRALPQCLSPTPHYPLSHPLTLWMRCRDGSEAQASGLADLGGIVPSSFRLSVDRVSVDDAGDGPIIRLNDMTYGVDSIELPPAEPIAEQQEKPTRLRRPVARTNSIGIKADVDLREGRNAIMGKASLPGEGEHLIVVISAKIIAP